MIPEASIQEVYSHNRLRDGPANHKQEQRGLEELPSTKKA